MTPKLLNYPFLSGGGPILSLGKRPYPVSGRATLSWARERASGRALCAVRGARAGRQERELVSNTVRFT